MLEDVQSVSLHTVGRQLKGKYVVRYEDGKNLLIDAKRGRSVYFDNRWYYPRTYHYLNQRSELGDVAISARKARPQSAFKLPEGEPRARYRKSYFIGIALFMALTGFLLLQFITTHNDTDLAAFSMLFLLSFIPPALLLPQADHRYVVDGKEIPLRKLVEKQDDELAGVAIVDAVKEEYGALLTDVVYRIENSALFDPATEPTRIFTETLARWDHDRSRLRPDQRQELAAEVRVTFDRARAHAQTLGLNHLPSEAQPKARVAAQALKLAADTSTTKEEREAATRKANDILESLMLYYLPRPTELVQLLGGKAPKALPGRRSEEAR